MNNQQIKKGAIISYVAIIISIVAGLFYTPWMISQIGKADYGLYMLMISVLTFFVIDYGLSQSVTRLLAKYRVEGDTAKIDNLLGLTAKLYLILDVLVIIALIVFYFFIDDLFIKLSFVEIIKFKQIYLIAAIFSVMSFPLLYISGIYYAFELFLQVKLFDLVSKLGSVFLTIVILLLGYGLTYLVLVYATTPFLINIGKVLYLKRKKYLNINWEFWNNDVLKGILSTSVWLLIILIGEVFLKNISPTLLGKFSGTEEIAIFAIANGLDHYIISVAAALNGLFLPRISFYLNQNNKEKLFENLMVKVGRFQILIIGFITIALILVGKDFILIWVGANFANSYYVLILLIIPTFLFSIIQIGTTYILAMNELKYQAYAFVLAAISNIIFSFILIPKFGAIGSGISIFLSKFIFYIAGFTFIFYKKFNIDMRFFYRNTFVPIIIPVILIVSSFLIFDYCTLPQKNIFSFVVNCLVLSFIFSTVVYLLYLKDNEKKLILNYLQKILGI